MHGRPWLVKRDTARRGRDVATNRRGKQRGGRLSTTAVDKFGKIATATAARCCCLGATKKYDKKMAGVSGLNN